MGFYTGGVIHGKKLQTRDIRKGEKNVINRRIMFKGLKNNKLTLNAEINNTTQTTLFLI